ncbi:GNAT family acetyltransferase [Emcibacter sp. SYSU 3D8]|uniref:GNAT family acetyltransferase n=1 Tax=Emcibacter sp. SYSU 3D8 TaxID=3133969 RepID=UPI0031FEB2B6
MPAGFVIDTLAESEIPQAVALWQACNLTRPWNDPHADARFALGGPGSTILAGRQGGVLIGAIMVGHDGHRGAVYYVGVLPDHRKLGIGAALMAAAEQWLQDRGVPKLNVMVRTGNLGARGFYECLGYEPSEVVVLSKRLGGC